MSNADKQLRDEFQRVLSGIAPAEFRELAAFEDLGAGPAYFESRKWMSALFGAQRDPHSEALGAKHYFRLWQPRDLDFDMLRHTYRSGGRVLTVTESVPLVAVDVRLADGDKAAKLSLPDRVTAIANELFHFERPVRFVEGEGGLVNNPKCAERPIDKWTDCIFAASTPGGVHFLIHKKDRMLERPRPRNFSIWFDEEFRSSRQAPKGG